MKSRLAIVALIAGLTGLAFLLFGRSASAASSSSGTPPGDGPSASIGDKLTGAVGTSVVGGVVAGAQSIFTSITGAASTAGAIGTTGAATGSVVTETAGIGAASSGAGGISVAPVAFGAAFVYTAVSMFRARNKPQDPIRFVDTGKAPIIKGLPGTERYSIIGAYTGKPLSVGQSLGYRESNPTVQLVLERRA